jgi:SAM-dependent methyltransferase
VTGLSRRLLTKYYANRIHPYSLFEQQVDSLIGPDTQVLLDAGCGRTMPVLKKYLGRVERLIGVELVDFTDVPDGIEALNTDLAKLPLPDSSIDLIMSRSVFEHLSDPIAVLREFVRVLRPAGAVVFLTPNMWDYGTLVARMVPNRFHASIVKHVEGRKEEDTFPTAYKTNTRRAVDRIAAGAGLTVERFSYLSQYPNYLLFNGALFFIGMCFEQVINRFESLRFLRSWILVTLRKPPEAIATLPLTLGVTNDVPVQTKRASLTIRAGRAAVTG